MPPINTFFGKGIFIITNRSLTPRQGLGEYTSYAFIADAMLGRLARWMRFLGFDTLYFRDIKDSRLIRIAREQDRIILTRDTRLVQIKGLNNYLLIKSDNVLDQLIEVINTFKISQIKPLSRCVACNGILKKITNKQKIKDSVPEFIFLNIHDFLECPDCGKIYWEGSHPRKFKEKLDKIIKEL